MGIAIVEAARCAERNRARREELTVRHGGLQERLEWERSGQDARRHEVHVRALVPFRDAFALVKNVELGAFEEFDLPVSPTLPTITVPAVRLSALGVLGSVAAGVAAAAGTGTATSAGVGAFAAASTGTPIASLSGAAATNATLAWLGGGSLAAGGGGVAAGTVVLGGVVMVPVAAVAVGALSWQGRRARRAQQATTAELDLAEAWLDREERRVRAVETHGGLVRAVLADLQDAISARRPALTALVADDADYLSYTPPQRRWLHALVDLVRMTVSVLSAPLLDDDGEVGTRSASVVADARRLLASLPEERTP